MHINVVFDGPPAPKPPGFVEVEDEQGRSIRLGEWIERPGGRWALRLPALGCALLFDGPPGHELPRLIRVEDEQGESADLGQWLQRSDDYWVLRFTLRAGQRPVARNGNGHF